MSADVAWLDARSYSKRFTVELIELYRSLQCLWRLKEGEPADRAERDCAWQKIVDKLREVEPNANRAFAMKKMNSFKTSWRREQKKARHRWAAGDHLYSPRLWYYDILRFIEDDGSPPGGSGSDQPTGGPHSVSDMDNLLYDMDEDVKEVDPFADEDADAQTTCDTSTPQSTSSDQRSTLGEQGRATSLISPPKQQHSRLDMLGRNWSEKLKLLPNDQRIYAEKLINDVLFEAEVGTLGRHCYIATQAQALPPATPKQQGPK